MNHFLLVGQMDGNLSRFLGILRSYRDIMVTRVETGQKALDLISDRSFDLVIVDEKLHDFTGLEFVEMMVKVNPMVLCAVISSIPTNEFYKSSEGLGVISQLATQPTREDVQHLMRQFKRVSNFTV